MTDESHHRYAAQIIDVPMPRLLTRSSSRCHRRHRVHPHRFQHRTFVCSMATRVYRTTRDGHKRTCCSNSRTIPRCPIMIDNIRRCLLVTTPLSVSRTILMVSPVQMRPCRWGIHRRSMIRISTHRSAHVKILGKSFVIESSTRSSSPIFSLATIDRTGT